MASNDLKQYQLFINGEWTDASSGKTFRSADPFTGEDWAELAEGDTSDVEAAIDAARAAFENSWWRREPRKRAQVLQRLADLL
ncbi:MAG: acyl-CoA reductase-like NAD-dependent aldehyde dehydrogenase, partial [Gammaproteobacteria bacterium]